MATKFTDIKFNKMVKSLQENKDELLADIKSYYKSIKDVEAEISLITHNLTEVNLEESKKIIKALSDAISNCAGAMDDGYKIYLEEIKKTIKFIQTENQKK
jgi:hypothetical protein